MKRQRREQAPRKREYKGKTSGQEMSGKDQDIKGGREKRENQGRKASTRKDKSHKRTKWLE